MQPSSSDAYLDVVEVCAVLQCLGFSIKYLDTEANGSQEGGFCTVIINCQESGLHVILDSTNLSRSCPSLVSQQHNGSCQVSGMTGENQPSKECGRALLESLSKSHRERLTKKLQDIVRCIKEHNESDVEIKEEPLANKSASMLDLKTPENRVQLKSRTPTRYRSLDALAAKEDDKKFVCQRQSTYFLSSTPETSSIRNKTLSPIQLPSQSTLDSLVAAEKVAEDLRNKLSNVIRGFIEEGNHGSSLSTLVWGVSKIADLKNTYGSKIKFASSPNLSGVGVQDNYINSFKRLESASSNNLASKSPAKNGEIATLKRISPNQFNNPPTILNNKNKSQDIKGSKLNNLPKPKIVTTVRVNMDNSDGSPNLSYLRKKYSHVKSTIPRLISKKE